MYPYWLDMCPCKKKSESSRKELSGLCVCLFECNRVEKRTKFRKLEPPGDTNLATVPVTNGISRTQTNEPIASRAYKGLFTKPPIH